MAGQMKVIFTLDCKLWDERFTAEDTYDQLFADICRRCGASQFLRDNFVVMPT